VMVLAVYSTHTDASRVRLTKMSLGKLESELFPSNLKYKCIIIRHTRR